jgi:two-component system, chemotaxis family, chemotaxis protein CheY
MKVRDVMQADVPTASPEALRVRDKKAGPPSGVRAQTAIVRTLVDELAREGRGPDVAEDLRSQAIEQSARLVSEIQALPKRSPRAPGLQPMAGAPSGWIARQGRKPRILVVDDDGATRDAIVRWLALEYEVTAAGDGLEGVECAQEAMFDAIVTDVWMPQMDGIEMAMRIREWIAPAFVPVLFLTGETAPERVAAGFFAGGTTYLIKPVDLELLEEELGRALGGPFACPFA